MKIGRVITSGSGAGFRPGGSGIIRACAVLVIFCIAPILAAQDADVVYLEGRPELRAGSARRTLDFGDMVRPGDLVVTGRRDYVELDHAGAANIRISPDTIFTLREIEVDGRRETVLTNTVGSVRYRMATLAGREQRVATGTVVAGVRGTEFTVFAASDGTSLFGVDTGLITVESAGVAVDVGTGEAVEVRAGQPPGEVVRWVGPSLDFSDWNRAQMERFLEDPVQGLSRLRERLDDYRRNAELNYRLFLESRETARRHRAEAAEIRSEQGDEAATEFIQQVVNPANREVLIHILNYRFYDMSALSLRRHVLSRLYVFMKTGYWNTLDDPRYREFEVLYHETLREFEQAFAARFDPEDI